MDMLICSECEHTNYDHIDPSDPALQALGMCLHDDDGEICSCEGFSVAE